LSVCGNLYVVGCWRVWAGSNDGGGVVTEPTAAEVARDLEQLADRVTRERVELFREMNRRFDTLEAALERHAVARITVDRYDADQLRLNSEMGTLRDEVTKIRKLVVLSPVAVIVAAIALAQFMAGV